MKILLLSDSYAPMVNGVVSSVTTLQRGLLVQGHDVRVLTSGDRKGSSFDGDVYRLSSIGLNALYPDARVARPMDRKVLDSIIQWAPDVVHSHTEFIAYIWARRLADELGSPHVHTYHTVYEDYTHYFSPSRNLGQKFASRFSRGILDRTDMAIAPTAKVRDLLTGYGVATPLRVIPTGIDLTRFTRTPGTGQLALAGPKPLARRRTTASRIRVRRPRPSVHAANQALSRPDLRRRLGLADDVPVVLFVGRLAQEKNLHETLRYMAALPATLPWRFVIVGDGPYASHLHQLVFELGIDDKVLFTGGVNPAHVADYYRLGDVFVSSSRSETQGLTFLEALASSLPVVCHEDPAIEDVIVNDVNGYTYTTREQFVSRMSNLLTSPEMRARLGEQARETALAHGEAPFVAAVVDAYEEAIRGTTLALTAPSTPKMGSVA